MARTSVAVLLVLLTCLRGGTGQAFHACGSNEACFGGCNPETEACMCPDAKVGLSCTTEYSYWRSHYDSKELDKQTRDLQNLRSILDLEESEVLHESLMEVVNLGAHEGTLDPGLQIHVWTLISKTNTDVQFSYEVAQAPDNLSGKLQLYLFLSHNKPITLQTHVTILSSSSSSVSSSSITTQEGPSIFVSFTTNDDNVIATTMPSTSALLSQSSSPVLEPASVHDPEPGVYFFTVAVGGVFTEEDVLRRLKGGSVRTSLLVTIDDNTGKIMATVASIIVLIFALAIFCLCINKWQTLKYEWKLWWGKASEDTAPVIIPTEEGESNQGGWAVDPNTKKQIDSGVAYGRAAQSSQQYAAAAGFAAGAGGAAVAHAAIANSRGKAAARNAVGDVATQLEGLKTAPEKHKLTVGTVLLVILVRIFTIIGDLIKIACNLSMLNTSFTIWIPALPQLEVISVNFPPWLQKAFFVVGDFLTALQELTQTFLLWNCGGVLQILSSAILILVVVFLFYLLSKDLLLVITIKIEKYKKTKFFRTRVGGIVFTSLSAMVVGISFYILQIVIMSLSSLVVGMVTIKRTCTQSDHTVSGYAFILLIIILVISILIIFFTFAGKPTRHYPTLGIFAIVPLLFDGIMRVVKLTLGFWTKDLCRSHNILLRAAKFDDDEYDEDNQHEKVIAVFGKSRGLIWVVIPACVVLSKLSEAVNAPAIFVWGENVYPRTPMSQRWKQWVSHVVCFGILVYCSLAPSLLVFYILLGAHAPLHVYMFFVDLYNVRHGIDIM